jgi:transcriptional regulator with XRE-family HTH domain
MGTRPNAEPVTLAEARHAACLTLAELAEAAQTSVQTLWKIEHGRTHPAPRTRRAVARAVGCAPARILWPRRPVAQNVRPGDVA